HIITSGIEHPAVIEVCLFLEKHGFEITFIPVDEFGLVDVKDIRKAIKSSTILISVMHANNEVGTIQPVEEIGKIARENNIIFHSDAAQSLGKIPVDVKKMGVDLLSVAGHKLYAPKGIGALYIKRGTVLAKQIHGADHEQNLRAGTENVLEIVGLGKACEIAKRDLQKNMEHMKKMRDLLEKGLKEKNIEFKLNGHPTKRLPNTLNLSFPGLEANLIITEMEGLAVSAGAACHSDSIDVSPVLSAMHVPIEYSMGAIRFSVGKMTTSAEIENAVEIVAEAIEKLKPTPEIKPVVLSSEQIKLTHFTTGLGCACKLRPQALEKILSALKPLPDSNILVGTNTADDAAVYLLNEETALVQTVDFFTPIVDDPYQFGSIAAANSLSDIYAMGAKPLFALNIVGFPSNRLPMNVLKQILKGARDKAAEAGISIIGGHTIDDNEPKFGLVILGTVHPKKILTNAAAKSGDVLILTKPLGLGIISTAIKRGLAEKKTENKVFEIMSELNKISAEVMEDFPVNACTDVTGFGLLGHLSEMSRGSGMDVEVYADKIPIIKEAREFASANIIPGGSLNNLEYVADFVVWNDKIPRLDRIILCDAQTSGGLLISLPEKFAEEMIQKLHEKGINYAAIIGKFREKSNGKIFVL
ncbi:MAG: selenide, water dikinase SelD, partial [Candidatus Cloacimonadota bacterium]